MKEEDLDKVLSICKEGGYTEKELIIAVAGQAGMLFFLNNPAGGYGKFPDKILLEAAAKPHISDYLDYSEGAWNEEVENITFGVILGSPEKCDVVFPQGELDEDNMDEDGEYWDGDYEYKCNYKINL